MGELVVGPRALPWKARLAAYAPNVRRYLTRGDKMSLWLFRALEDMDAGDRRPGEPVSLMPEDHLLELFVTATDFHG